MSLHIGRRHNAQSSRTANNVEEQQNSDDMTHVAKVVLDNMQARGAMSCEDELNLCKITESDNCGSKYSLCIGELFEKYEDALSKTIRESLLEENTIKQYLTSNPRIRNPRIRLKFKYYKKELIFDVTLSSRTDSIVISTQGYPHPQFNSLWDPKKEKTYEECLKMTILYMASSVSCNNYAVQSYCDSFDVYVDDISNIPYMYPRRIMRVTLDLKSVKSLSPNEQHHLWVYGYVKVNHPYESKEVFIRVAKEAQMIDDLE